MTRWHALVAAAILGTAPAQDSPAPPGEAEQGPPTEKVVLGGETYALELAADPKAREKGLMGRKTIAERGGMLFVFPDQRHRVFWMKHCLVDMDLIYLDREGRLVSVHRMKVERPQGRVEGDLAYERRLRRYVSRRRAQFAIELKAGSAQRLKLKVGQTIELDRKRLEALARKNEDPPNAPDESPPPR